MFEGRDYYLGADGNAHSFYGALSQGPVMGKNITFKGTGNPNVILSKEIDLGQGWKARKDKGSESNGTQDHTHVWNPKKGNWSQNQDGSVHDEHANSPGQPPGWVQKELKNKNGWDWAGNKKKQESNPIPIIPIPALAPEEGLGTVSPAHGGWVPVIVSTQLLDEFINQMQNGFAQPS